MTTPDDSPRPWGLIIIGCVVLAAMVTGCGTIPAPTGDTGSYSALAPPSSSPPPSVLSPYQAQAAQAQQDKDRILSSPGWQPVAALAIQPTGGMPGDDWVGVKCSSQAPDTPPNAAVGGNLTLTIWNPGPDDQYMTLDEVDFPGGGQLPVNPEDISSSTVVASGVVDVFHTSYTSLVGSWAPGCFVWPQAP